MRPDLPDDKIFQDDDGTLVFNTYRQKQHGPVGGDLDAFWDFVEHLIPSDTELDYFLDWHAAKVANPSWRMHALMMVAPQVFGTGRGTWFQILEKLFMPLYVRGIDFHQLTGQGSQGQYNDYMADSLMVCVKESQQQQQSKWVTRHNAYEAFKEVCDTYADFIQIKRKYGHTSYQRTYTSFIIASNHSDAFAIEPGDRRLLVIDNTTTPLAEAPGDLMRRILAFKDDSESISTLYHWFLDRWQRGIGHDVFGTPPDTPAKQRMISAGLSDVDELFDLYVDTAPGDICTNTQLRRWMVDQARGGEFDLPDGQKFEAALAGILKKRACRFSGNSKWQISVDDTKVRPWILRNAARWMRNPGNDAVRAEIQKNGPVSAKVLKGDFRPQD